MGFMARSPIEDSLLARQGTRDPVGEQSWGQVADQGGLLLIAAPLTDSTSVAMSATLANQRGTRVADNRRQAVRLDLSHDTADRLAELDLDYWRVGPFIEGMRWEENLSHFSWGHGGYFSPERLWRLGVQSELLTAEAREWQIKATASLSWNLAKEAAAPRYPLSSDETFYASDRSSGLGGDLNLAGVRRVTNHLLIGGYLRYTAASDYQDSRFGLVVYVPFSPRTSVMSTDLPLNRLP